MKLKVGDKVKLKNRRGKEWNRNGKMDKYIGKIVTVSNITLGNGFTILITLFLNGLITAFKYLFSVSSSISFS